MFGEYIWMLFYSIALIGVGALVCAIGYGLAYGAICVCAWIEDEIGRLVRYRRRKARLRARAMQYKAGIHEWQ